MARGGELHIRLSEIEEDELRELAALWYRNMADTVRHAVHEAVMRERYFAQQLPVMAAERQRSA